MFLGRENDERTARSTSRRWRCSRAKTLAGAVRAHRQVGAPDGRRASPAASARPSPSPRPCSGTRKVVILDEPTAALGVAQTQQVLDLVRRLADHGLGVVLISHNMNDVFEVADRIVRALPRPGRRRGQERATTTHAQVVELITAGRSGDLGLRARRASPGLRGGSMSTTDTPPAPAPPPLSTAASDFAIDTAERTLRSSVDDYFARIRGGDLGALPAILGLVVLFILFSITADNFLTTAQLREPAHPGDAGDRHRDRPHVRAAARRDRPLRRLRPRVSAPSHGVAGSTRA